MKSNSRSKGPCIKRLLFIWHREAVHEVVIFHRWSLLQLWSGNIRKPSQNQCDPYPALFQTTQGMCHRHCPNEIPSLFMMLCQISYHSLVLLLLFLKPIISYCRNVGFLFLLCEGYLAIERHACRVYLLLQ